MGQSSRSQQEMLLTWSVRPRVRTVQFVNYLSSARAVVFLSLYAKHGVLYRVLALSQ